MPGLAPTPPLPWLFAPLLGLLAIGGLGSCSPDESKTGTLGNGVFSYDCIDSQDPNCPNAAALDQQPFPSAIAFGGRFSLTYTPTDRTMYPNVTVGSVSSDFFASQGEVFGALRVGTPWFVALSQDGKVLDITPVNVAPIASVRVTDVSSSQPGFVGTMHTFAAVAEGGLGQPLAGAVLYSWTSSDPTVAAIQSAAGDTSPSSSVSVLFAGAGQATLTARTTTAQGSVLVSPENAL
jgi:hypothetical protein